jgi:Rrf2 family protein
MNLSKKSRYGLRALIDLASSAENEHVALNNIAERNGISPQYLEQVFASLRKSGLVKSIKGAQGGYRLARSPKEITVSQILEALDGSYLIDEEEGKAGGMSEKISKAIQIMVIDAVNRDLTNRLNGITLEDMKEFCHTYEDQSYDMYYI